MREWQLNEAQAHFPELLRCAREMGPQAICTEGQFTAVLISIETFESLSRGRESLSEFVRRSPLADSEDLDLARDRSLTRDISF